MSAQTHPEALVEKIRLALEMNGNDEAESDAHVILDLFDVRQEEHYVFPFPRSLGKFKERRFIATLKTEWQEPTDDN